MSTIVEATLSAEQFALSETLRRRPSTEFETVQVVVDGTDRTMPFLWATADDLDGLPSVVAEDPTTRDVDVLTAFEEEYLFRVEWTDRIRAVCRVIVEERGPSSKPTPGTTPGRFAFSFRSTTPSLRRTTSARRTIWT